MRGFSLVELVVSITLLSILGTIAFISLQGYSCDAIKSFLDNENSKVESNYNDMKDKFEKKCN